jgi:thiol:disulfide interchange protein
MRQFAAFTLLAVGLALAPLAGANDAPSGFDPEQWMQGAQGVYDALRRVEQGDERPMVVYFYTDWCGYCRQFEGDLLGAPAVKRHFSDLMAVRVNPEAGEREREIASYYGVSGYPAFFVRNASTGAMSRVERVVVEQGQPRLMTPAEFIAAVDAAAGA